MMIDPIESYCTPPVSGRGSSANFSVACTTSGLSAAGFTSMPSAVRSTPGDARRGQRRVIAQHPIRLLAMIARRAIRLDRQRYGDPEREYQQDGHYPAASHPETSHGMKNPS